MQSQRQAWWHVFQLGMVLGAFYGCFVIGVRWFEWNWLRQLGFDGPAMTIPIMTEILVVWSIVVPLAISLVYLSLRGFLANKTPAHAP